MNYKNMLLVTSLFVSSSLLAKTIFTVRSPESQKDTRLVFEHDLLSKILEVTKDTYGEYSIKMAHSMNHQRMRVSTTFDVHPNLFFTDSWSTRTPKNMTPIPIPIQRGIVGHRLMLINRTNRKEFSKITSYDEIKDKLILQGEGWQDVALLKENQLKVITGNSYNGLFSMIQNKRADIFLRGVHEIYKELNLFSKNNPDLSILKSALLYYPFPRVFYTDSKNKKAIERVTYGLKAIMKNGTFIKVWNRHYGEDLKKVKNIKYHIKLNNPFLPEKFDPSKYYWINVK